MAGTVSEQAEAVTASEQMTEEYAEVHLVAVTVNEQLGAVNVDARMEAVTADGHQGAVTVDVVALAACVMAATEDAVISEPVLASVFEVGANGVMQGATGGLGA